MKVNYIDENGNNVTKEIEIDFNNISEVDFQKCFEGCTTFNADKFILENVQNYSLAEIQQILLTCTPIHVLAHNNTISYTIQEVN